jgi:hypothetical protein
MLNALIGLVLAFMVPTVMGFLILRLMEISSKTPLHYRLPNVIGCAVGTVIGWIFITFCMRVQHALGLPASAHYTFAIPLALSLALLALVGRRAYVTAPIRATAIAPSTMISVTVIALLGLPLVLEAGLQPLPGWDAWDFWAARAKVWFFTGDLADNRLLRNEDYPPAVSLMMLWVARAAGAWRDDLFSYISLLHLFSAGVVMYWALKSRSSNRVALVGVAFALGAPLIAVHAITGGYVDLPLACALVVAVSLLMCLPRRAALSQYAVPIALALCLPFYKIPGLFWFAIFLMGAVAHIAVGRAPIDELRKKYMPHAVTAIALAITIFLVATLRSPQEALRIGNYTIKFKLNDGASFVFTELFVTGSFLLLWIGIGRFFAIKHNSPTSELKSEIGALTTIVTLGFAFVVAAVFLSNSIEWWADGSTLNRALIHLAPTAILLVIIQAYSALKTSS